MTQLTTAIDHVEDLTLSIPAEHHGPRPSQVIEPHETPQTQRERYKQLVTLTEYADRNMSDEVRSQSAWLEMLERCHALAKTLRSEVDDVGTRGGEGAQERPRGGARFSLSEAAELFQELDALIGTIKSCYVKLHKLWTDESILNLIDSIMVTSFDVRYPLNGGGRRADPSPPRGPSTRYLGAEKLAYADAPCRVRCGRIGITARMAGIPGMFSSSRSMDGGQVLVFRVAGVAACSLGARHEWYGPGGSQGEFGW
ncbi:hypothetical protein FA95DRAFT_1631527 [Auriscalpium vulgare]|uniref:Uncharacterized protein n=1 Tax=Auriscalpium vulgare TaxID=40419 RepID=A0ACB8RH30_9AGAM|nr:hypothetical protein FA95DRAFT_1631527 [Auriscalpium vulgare]